MSNGPARQHNIDNGLQAVGHEAADPYEISTIRKEDYQTHKGKTEYEDLLQISGLSAAASSRGHQGKLKTAYQVIYLKIITIIQIERTSCLFNNRKWFR